MCIDCTAAATQMTAVTHNAPAAPKMPLTPPAIAPKAPAATKPKTVSRALVFDRVMSGGTTLGVTAALSTVNDLDSTIMPSAAGYSPQSLKCGAISTAIGAGPPADTDMA